MNIYAQYHLRKLQMQTLKKKKCIQIPLNLQMSEKHLKISNIFNKKLPDVHILTRVFFSW